MSHTQRQVLLHLPQVGIQQSSPHIILPVLVFMILAQGDMQAKNDHLSLVMAGKNTIFRLSRLNKTSINAASPTGRSKITSKHAVSINQSEQWLRKEA